MAPDITADLYDESSSLVCDDDDWKSFLASLNKQGCFNMFMCLFKYTETKFAMCIIW